MSMLVVYCLRNMDFAGASHALPEIIARSLAIKARVVEQDPTEQGLRRVLNFGHTIGHAIESCAGGGAPPWRVRGAGYAAHVCAGAAASAGGHPAEVRPAHDLRLYGPAAAAIPAARQKGRLRRDLHRAGGRGGRIPHGKETPEEILRRWEGAET